MSKHLLQQQVIQALQAALDNAIRAAQAAHETATHEENIAENKYDTLGLEAAYLAVGQSRRVEELQAALHAWQRMPLSAFDQTRGIGLGCLVSLQDQDGKSLRLLLGPDGAGLKIADPQGEILLITAQAPLGKLLLGHVVDDELKLGTRHWLILEAE